MSSEVRNEDERTFLRVITIFGDSVLRFWRDRRRTSLQRGLCISQALLQINYFMPEGLQIGSLIGH
jgi:hypothetical protein